jgi:hypothetical protein
MCASAALAIITWRTSDAKALSRKGSMVLFGSSSMNGSLGHLMADDFAELGFRVSRHGYSAAGLARPDFRDMRQTLDQLPIERSATSVVLYIGGNDAQSLWLSPSERISQGSDDQWLTWRDPRWPSVYEARARELISSLCARGAQYAIVLPPADVMSARLQSRLDRVRPALQRAAEATHCGRFVSTRGDAGHFVVDGEPLRAIDGVHMTRSGALRVWKRIRETVLSLVLVPPPVARLD